MNLRIKIVETVEPLELYYRKSFKDNKNIEGQGWAIYMVRTVIKLCNIEEKG